MKKKIVKGMLIILFFYLGISALLPYTSGVRNLHNNLLDDDITVTVITKDGLIHRYDSNAFPVVDRGDRVVATLKLPNEHYSFNGTLCFNVQHAWVKLLYMDKVLYTYGEQEAADGRQIGAIYPKLYIPREAWGNSLTLILNVTEDHAFAKLRGFTILPSQDSFKYELMGHQLEFCIFITVMVVSALMLLFFLTFGLRKSVVRVGLYLSIFGVLISVWILSSLGLLQMFIENVRVSQDMEYIALFLVPFPFIMLFYETQPRVRTKKILLGFACFMAVFFIVCTILNYTTTRFHYCQTISILHVLMLSGAILLLFMNFRSNGKKNISNTIMQYGMGFLIIAAIADIFRYHLERYSSLNVKLIAIAITPLGVLLFICAGIVGAVYYFTASIMSQNEKEHLLKLAYIDVMTGLANRAGCEKEISELKARGIKEYAIVFLDLNNLKTANDEYGHTIGDLYITSVAKLIAETFEGIGFCGRMGGDEFIVIVGAPRNRLISIYVEEFDFRIQKLNQTNIIPFEIAVARGTVLSTRKVPVDIEEAVKMADASMYSNKEKKHRTRSSSAKMKKS